MLLNLGLSGFAYSGADVGGFIGAPSADLMTRWIEIASFTPYFRAHSAKDTPRKEPWMDGPRHTDIRRKYIEERYRLLPYIYALADENSRSGAPLMRPLFYEFPDMLSAPCDQSTSFLLGEALLIAPSPDLESPAPYEACLPRGIWYDYWSGEKKVSNPAAANADSQRLNITPNIARLPIFIRGGAIIPRQPLVQSTAETPAGPLTLDVYPGENCHGILYWDDGHSMAFEHGGYLRQKIRCTPRPGGVDVQFEAREGQYKPWWHQLALRIHDWHGHGRCSTGREAASRSCCPQVGSLGSNACGTIELRDTLYLESFYPAGSLTHYGAAVSSLSRFIAVTGPVPCCLRAS